MERKIKNKIDDVMEDTKHAVRTAAEDTPHGLAKAKRAVRDSVEGTDDRPAIER